LVFVGVGGSGLRRDVRDIHAGSGVRVLRQPKARFTNQDFTARLGPVARPLLKLRRDGSLNPAMPPISSRHLAVFLPRHAQLPFDEPSLLPVVGNCFELLGRHQS
jgi:hypothetical protein